MFWKIQNTLVESPLTTLRQEMSWGQSAMLPSPHGATAT